MDKILVVDDDPNILESYRRQFRKVYQVWTAQGGEQGLNALDEQGPFAVVVADFRMPGMDGIQFLSRARERAPETVRMMLTGNTDLHTAMEAVNQGWIFRFLTKPCPPETLGTALEAAVSQYHLLRAEKELLEGTLTGSLKALTEVLVLVSPESFGRSSRIKRAVTLLAEHLGLASDWCLDIATTLSQLGGVVLPRHILAKVSDGEPLSADETRIFNKHPSIGASLLGKIPRMEQVCEIIQYQEKRFDGSGVPEDQRREAEIPLGARLLKVALDYDALRSARLSPSDIVKTLEERKGWYDPAVLEALKATVLTQRDHREASCSLPDLVPGMVLAEDLTDKHGVLLLAEGQELTQLMITHLKQVNQSRPVKQPIRVKLETRSAVL